MSVVKPDTLPFRVAGAVSATLSEIMFQDENLATVNLEDLRLNLKVVEPSQSLVEGTSLELTKQRLSVGIKPKVMCRKWCSITEVGEVLGE